MTPIKNLLKNARKSKDLTLQTVSTDTGIPLTTINSWERGASYPRGKNRDIIAKYYGLPKDSLDYSNIDPDTGSRALNIGQITHDLGMTDYETKPILMHKKHWELASALVEKHSDADLSQMIARLVIAASKGK